MLVATLPGPTRDELERQIFNFQGQADVLELRPDLYTFSNLDWVGSHPDYPFLLAGGSEIPAACFVDIPYEQWSNVPSHAKKICSYHNFQNTPDNLEEIFEKMLLCPAHIYKLSTMACSALDGFRMLRLVRKAKKRGIPIVGHCMGEVGQFTRVLGKIMGNHWTYCTVDKPIAPGQMSLEEMRSIYHIDKLNSSTQIYGLIGDPVSLSRGHLFHNHYFIEKNYNAVYVKITLKSEELEEGLNAAKDLGFKGLSVTMPLKEKIGRLCTPPIAVCNTISFSEGFRGTNTDGDAALALMKKKMALKGTRALIVGWGGVGKEIASKFRNEGVDFTVLNRTAKDSILPLSAWNTLDLENYAIIIQATNVGMGNPDASPVDWDKLCEHHLVLEAISNPIETSLVRTARTKGCRVITGKDLFEEQAYRQHQHWGIHHGNS